MLSGLGLVGASFVSTRPLSAVMVEEVVVAMAAVEAVINARVVMVSLPHRFHMNQILTIHMQEEVVMTKALVVRFEIIKLFISSGLSLN